MPFFNTAGPVNTLDHFSVDPLTRPEASEILKLIEQKKYFLLHAPRQTGKTSLLISLAKELNNQGNVKALYLNVEPSALYQEDPHECFKSILAELCSRARDYLDDPYPEEIAHNLLEKKGPGFALNEVLTLWAKRSNKPLVLLFDEVDALEGDLLASFLKQIRSGFDKRPDYFPQSIILCGVQDIRHKVLKHSDERDITGGDIFNIESKSIRLGPFSQDDVQKLFSQYDLDSGIKTSPEASKKAWELTRGQPWLINAIAYELVEEMLPCKVGMSEINENDVEEAVENIIQRQEIHLKNLTERLKEERVRRIITPILVGSDFPKDIEEGDLRYLAEQGLLNISGSIEISNPIYKEIIPRALIHSTQVLIQYKLAAYLTDSGSLNMNKIMSSFQVFFSKHAKLWNSRFAYKEAGAHLFLQAFLQRIIDGGGRLKRLYGLGRKQVTLIISWPVGGSWQKVLVSSRYIYRSVKDTIKEGTDFIVNEMDALDIAAGHLVLFYPTHVELVNRKQFHQSSSEGKYNLEIWGM